MKAKVGACAACSLLSLRLRWSQALGRCVPCLLAGNPLLYRATYVGATGLSTKSTRWFVIHWMTSFPLLAALAPDPKSSHCLAAQDTGYTCETRTVTTFTTTRQAQMA